MEKRYVGGMKGLYSVVVTLATCGTVLYIEIKEIQGKLSPGRKFNVFDVEKNNTPYIYIRNRELELQSKTQDIRKKYLNPEKIKQETWFPWLQSHSQDPWTLLKLTRSSNKSARLLGVKALAEIDDWEDYQYRYITQACDGRTLVGLARSPNADPRFFSLTPKLKAPEESFTTGLKHLLSSLPLDGVDKCIEYFTSLALEKTLAVQDKGPLWNLLSYHDVSPNSQHIPEELLQLYFLEALESHSKDPDQCRHIVELGGLHTLTGVVTGHNSVLTVNIHKVVTRIIGNSAVSDDLHSEIMRHGWISRLYEWAESSDLELSHLAARALLNLDRDYTSDVCHDSVFVLHPLHRTSEEVQCDVVFVHGIKGGPFRTWRQRDASRNTHLQSSDDQSMCWPKDWLSKDCPNVRILSVEYDTHVSEWYIRCPHNKDRRTIATRGKHLLEELGKVGIGSRPVIWVGHSMGGLLIKQMLSLSLREQGHHQVSAQTKGVIFYSVPHRGSPVANKSYQARYFVNPSVEVQELSRDSEQLKVLHKNFLSFVQKNGVLCLSFGETAKISLGKNLPKVLVVPPESSDPGVGEFYTIDANHIDICKPTDPSSKLYVLPLKLIRRCILQDKVEKFLRSGIALDKNKLEEHFH